MAAIRIIPARAGFTTGPPPPSAPTRDHPRSRGVYPASQSMHHMTRGSSPLARGLHFRAESGGAESGIIPARAGFTGRPGRRAQGVRDHPRSRGVYHCRDASRSRAVGSSPLARGLRSTDGPIASLSGIIPARAGFTGHRHQARRAEEDHPRSRGVYALMNSLPGSGFGSSPLARGLRLPVVGVGLPGGIIPARAGFTPVRALAGQAHRDHPRSRGVYAGGEREDGRIHGSSPLARGLPRERGPVRHYLGIIPARAGFTRRQAAGAPQE